MLHYSQEREISEIKFEWDENKNFMNKEKHKIPFETAAHVFDEDCQELSPAMMKAFKSAVAQRNRRKKA